MVPGHRVKVAPVVETRENKAAAAVRAGVAARAGVKDNVAVKAGLRVEKAGLRVENKDNTPIYKIDKGA